MENEKDNKKNKKEKECLFSFARINSYYLFPFIAPVFCCLGNFFIHEVRDGNAHMKSECFFTIFIDLSYFIGGLLYFISYIETKTEETKDNAIVYKERANSNSNVVLIYNDRLKQNYIKIILFLCLISLLITLTSINNLYSYKKNVFEKRLYYIFFIAILSKYILKNGIYKHQILSLVITFIGLIFLFIPNFFVVTKDDILINISNVFAASCYSLFLVLIKHLTHNYFISPLLCLLYIGFLSIIFTFIIFAVYSLIVNHDLSFIKENFDFSQNKMGPKYYIFLAIGLFFSSCLQLCTIFVVYYFSPILICVTDSLSPMLSWIITLIQTGVNDGEYKIIVLKSFGFFFQLVAGLIYNEIIICNFCGFNKNTKKYLSEKEKEEFAPLKLRESSIESGKYFDEKENDTSYNSDNEDNKSD